MSSQGERGPQGDHGQIGDTGPPGPKGTTPSLGRYFWPRLGLVLIVVAVLVGGGVAQLAVASKRAEEVVKTNQVLDLRHRIRQEECMIRVLNDVVEKRINAQTREPIDLCDLEDLPHLKELLAEAEAELARSGIEQP